MGLLVKQERSGWRDEALSKRHRMWGWDVPMVDFDFIVAEYDRKKVQAIIEYKNEFADIELSSASIDTIADYTDQHPYKTPFFIVKYACDLSWFKVFPCNTHARNLVPKKKLIGLSFEVDEEHFVNFLYWLRGRGKAPDDVIKAIKDNKITIDFPKELTLFDPVVTSKPVYQSVVSTGIYCDETGHNFQVLKDSYYRYFDSGDMVDTKDGSTEYKSLFCTKCGLTKEVVAAFH